MVSKQGNANRSGKGICAGSRVTASQAAAIDRNRGTGVGTASANREETPTVHRDKDTLAALLCSLAPAKAPALAVKSQVAPPIFQSHWKKDRERMELRLDCLHHLHQKRRDSKIM